MAFCCPDYLVEHAVRLLINFLHARLFTQDCLSRKESMCSQLQNWSVKLDFWMILKLSRIKPGLAGPKFDKMRILEGGGGIIHSLSKNGSFLAFIFVGNGTLSICSLMCIEYLAYQLQQLSLNPLSITTDCLQESKNDIKYLQIDSWRNYLTQNFTRITNYININMFLFLCKPLM